MGSFKKYVTCIISFFTQFNFVTICQFYSINSLVLFKKLCNQRKEDFLQIWLLERITLYQRRQVITSLDTIEFLDTHYTCVNNPHRQSSGLIIFLCKYCIVISNKLICSFLDVFFLLLAVILPKLHEKPRRNTD